MNNEITTEIKSIQKQLQEIEDIKRLATAHKLQNLFNTVYPIRLQLNITVYHDKVEIEKVHVNNIHAFKQFKNELMLKSIDNLG